MLKIFATNDFKIIKLRDNSISCGKETHPLIGVSARVENGSDIEKRVTFTRLLLLGIFAFAMQKKKGGEKYLCIEGPDFAWMTAMLLPVSAGGQYRGNWLQRFSLLLYRGIFW